MVRWGPPPGGGDNLTAPPPTPGSLSTQLLHHHQATAPTSNLKDALGEGGGLGALAEPRGDLFQERQCGVLQVVREADPTGPPKALPHGSEISVPLKIA